MKHLLLTTIAAVVLVGCGNPEADRSLFEAIRNGKIEIVKESIADGANINAFNANIISPLHYAVSNGQKDIVDLLINEGANVNFSGGNRGFSPLHVSVLNNQVEITELLVKNDADLTLKNAEGKTSLDFADGVIADLLRKHGGKTGAELKAEGN